MLGRRAFVAGTMALAALPVQARKPPKAALIHWPGPDHELHGFMAIPAGAHGAQPAVLVLGMAETYARAVATWVAMLGFVACAPRSLDRTDLLATVRWLATNRYATGRVGAVLLGTGAEQLPALAPSLACAVACGVAAAAPPLPVLSLDRLAPETPQDYDRTAAFLKEHLR